MSKLIKVATEKWVFKILVTSVTKNAVLPLFSKIIYLR